MKIILLACLLVGVYCDNVPVSSYSSLPYETDPGYFANSIHEYEPQMYEYPERGKSKLAFHFGKMVEAPLNIVKGATDYVTNVLTDLKGRLLHLKGSIARTKGNSLVSYGEDLLRKSHIFRGYKRRYRKFKKPKHVFQYVEEHQPYHPELPQPQPTVYETPTQIYTSPDAYDASSGRGFAGPKPSDVVYFSGFRPSRSVALSNDLGTSRGESALSLTDRDTHISVDQSAKVADKKVAVAESEPRVAISLSAYEDDRPIPVPVPIAIAPSRLVFPQLPHH